MPDATSNPDLDLFARVQDGKIVEFPVYRLHIINRAHPLSWYTPVTETVKPELPPYHRYDKKASLENGQVFVTHVAVPYTLGEMLSQLGRYSDNPLETQPIVPLITDLDPSLVSHIYGLASDYLTSQLNAFAATRNYGTPTVDPLTSVLSYLTSSIASFQAEAQRVQQLRDEAWVSMIEYFSKVTSGELPVPTSLAEIDAVIPSLVWNN